MKDLEFIDEHKQQPLFTLTNVEVAYYSQAATGHFLRKSF